MMFKNSFYWGIIVLIFAIIPGTYVPEVQNIWNLLQWDKLIHVFLFAIFVMLLINDLQKQKKVRFLQKSPVLFALSFGMIFGLFTEMIQLFEFLQRNSNVYDLIADVVGCALGIILFYGLYKKKAKYYFDVL
ncbi:MAG: VanZ family protein [Bacteroidales bacterium]|nr:VanZ family protein [Bacteroidales bacterium]